MPERSICLVRPPNFIHAALLSSRDLAYAKPTRMLGINFFFYCLRLHLNYE